MRAIAIVAALAVTGTAAAAKPKPDLTVTEVAHQSGPVTPGNYFTVSAKVHDAGAGKAAKSLTVFSLEISGKRRQVGAVLTKKIAPGQTRTVIGLMKAPQVDAGSYPLFACADGEKAVKETKDANNCKRAKDPVSVAGARR